jgi:hypothetical protein
MFLSAMQLFTVAPLREVYEYPPHCVFSATLWWNGSFFNARWRYAL